MSLWELPQNFSRISLQFLFTPFGTISPRNTLPPILCGFGSCIGNFPLIILSVRLFEVCRSIHRLIQPFIFVIDGRNDPVHVDLEDTVVVAKRCLILCVCVYCWKSDELNVSNSSILRALVWGGTHSLLNTDMLL